MKIIYTVLGFISLGLGLVGIPLPVLPTTPFLLLSGFCFAKSSPRLNSWFVSSGVYKKYLHSFVESRSMTLRHKLTILLPVSSMLIITFILVDLTLVRSFILILMVCKYLYFFLRIKTIKD